MVRSWLSWLLIRGWCPCATAARLLGRPNRLSPLLGDWEDRSLGYW